MASDEQDTDENEERNPAADVRKLGMRAWARAALSAQGERSGEMLRVVAQVPRFQDVTIPEMRGSEEEEIAIELVRWMSMLFLNGRSLAPREAATLRRIWTAVRPASRPERIRVAAEAVKEHALRMLELPEAVPQPRRVRQVAATLLNVEAYAVVDEDFAWTPRQESSTSRCGPTATATTMAINTSSGPVKPNTRRL